MAAALLPTETEIANFDSVDKVIQWAGLDAATWTVINAQLGNLTHIRMIAGLPLRFLQQTLTAARIPVRGSTTPRELSAAETTFVWRAARRACGLEDMDPLAERAASPTGPPTTTAATGGLGAKKVKASNVVDQLDESEVDLLTRAELDTAYLRHVEVTGSEPSAEAEPTPEQVAGLRDKVIKRGEAPYTDFSVLTPYGRRVQQSMKTRSVMFQPDGTFRYADIPGPPSFQAWAACWKVYRACIYMLRHEPIPPSVTFKMVAKPAAVLREHPEDGRRVSRSLAPHHASREQVQIRRLREIPPGAHEGGCRRKVTNGG